MAEVATKPMTMERAIRSIGINVQKRHLENMRFALGLCSYKNTPEERERLACAKYILRNWKKYEAERNRIRERIRHGIG